MGICWFLGGLNPSRMVWGTYTVKIEVQIGLKKVPQTALLSVGRWVQLLSGQCSNERGQNMSGAAETDALWELFLQKKIVDSLTLPFWVPWRAVLDPNLLPQHGFSASWESSIW